MSKPLEQRALIAMQEHVKARAPRRSAPEPLRRAISQSGQYPVEALGEVLGKAAKAIHEVVQCPLAVCAQSILAAASVAVQGHADVIQDGRREPLSLWHVTVADSGERKSAADGLALRAHKEHEAGLWESYRFELGAYEQERRAFEAAIRKAEKGKDRSTIRNAIEAVGTPPQAPVKPLILVPEATLEGLHKLYQCGRPSLGLMNDDAGDFLDGHAMSRDNRTKSAAGFSKLWDDGQFSRIRAGDGAEKFYGRRLAMHMMIQPVIAERVLSDDVLTGQGFLPRCLLAWPESNAGNRPYVQRDLTKDPAMQAYWNAMNTLLNRRLPTRPENCQELEPRALTLDADAVAVWIEVHDAIEKAIGGDFVQVKAWASKSPAQVLRVAGVLTMVENPEAGSISKAAIERATAIVSFHLKESVRIVGTASVPRHIRNAETLRDWCWAEQIEFLYSTIALQRAPAVIRTVESFTEAMGVLVNAGWADIIEDGMELDGRNRKRVWRVLPKVEA